MLVVVAACGCQAILGFTDTAPRQTADASSPDGPPAVTDAPVVVQPDAPVVVPQPVHAHRDGARRRHAVLEGGEEFLGHGRGWERGAVDAFAQRHVGDEGPARLDGVGQLLDAVAELEAAVRSPLNLRGAELGRSGSTVGPGPSPSGIRLRKPRWDRLLLTIHAALARCAPADGLRRRAGIVVILRRSPGPRNDPRARPAALLLSLAPHEIDRASPSFAQPGVPSQVRMGLV
jgi:hypothetical protein